MKDRRFIETESFPVELVNMAAAKEKSGGGRPSHWEMVFWWTRKPLITARAIIAGALLPEEFPRDRFLKMLNLHVFDDKKAKVKTPHRLNPSIPPDVYEEYFKGKSLLDPFAGFGSIPLEALRLGLSKVVAVELLPVAHIFLKAVLEYPKKYGKQLVRDIKEQGKWVIERLREDPDVRELYGEDVAVYIGTWEVKHGDYRAGNYHWTPLVGNWWLARVKDRKGGWKALAWMKPVKTEKGVEIRVEDAREVFGDLKRVKVFPQRGAKRGIEIDRRRVYVGWDRLNGEPNIDAKRQKAVCLYCGGEIADKVEDGKTREEVWYVKYALRDWNRRLEEYLEGRITLDELREGALARPRLLVKVKVADRDLKFEPCTEEDNEKLWKALEKLKQIWGDPDIPTEPIPPYGNIGGGLRFPVTIVSKWYEFFNPRQLLTLVKLVKLIREAGKMVEEEKIEEGWSEEEAFSYAEAVTTYLAITLVRYADYDCMVTFWNYGGQLPAQVAHALSMRGIAMSWNWGDVSPFAEMSGTGTLKMNLDKITKKILLYLVSAVSIGSNSLNQLLDSNNSKDEGAVEVMLDDARSLLNLKGERFDLIVTDPPYYNDVAYTELSDFYYVWLKRVLSDSDGYSLTPRFHKEAFFDEWGNNVETQWSAFARDEITLNIGRFKHFGVLEDEQKGKDLYAEMLAQSFEAMASKLKEDGLLVTYFAHSDPDAWKALIYAGWRRAGLRVTVGFPLLTESEHSVVSRGKAAISASIAVVWRRRGSEVLDLSKERQKIVERLVEDFRRYRNMGFHGVTLYTMLYARAIGELTNCSKLMDGARELDVDDIVLEAGRLVGKSIVTGANPEIVSSEASLYLTLKIVGVKPDEGGRRRLPSSDLILVSYGTLSLNEAQKLGLVRPVRGTSGAEVSKRKVYELVEPADDSESAVLEALGIKDVDPGKPESVRNSVDVLHILELYADRSRSVIKEKYAELSQLHGWAAKEALELAKAIAEVDEDDPEAARCRRLLKQLMGDSEATRW